EDRVALRCRVLGMATDVEVEAGAVGEEDVGGPAPRDDPAEQVAGDLVRAEPSLAAQRAGHPVLALEAEDATLHAWHATVPGPDACSALWPGPMIVPAPGAAVRRPPSGGTVTPWGSAR